MNLRFVEAFYWVVTLKSVSRAAEKLHLTQSAMSSRLAVLEQELGTALFDRRDKTLRVTAAGQRFLGYAERLLALQSELRAELGGSGVAGIAGLGGLAKGRPLVLRLGAIESVLHSWLLDWVQALRAEQAALALELTVETSPILADQLVRGTLDIVLGALPAAGTGVRSQALPPMAMAFVGHSEHHRKRRYSLADLATLELLTFQRGSLPQVALVDLFARARLSPLRLHSLSSISAMAQLVEAGLGVATLPRAVAERLARTMPLKVLACEAELPALPLHLSWRDDPASPVQQALIEHLLAHVGAGAARPARSVRPTRRADQQKIR